MAATNFDSFEKLGLHSSVCAALAAKGVKEPRDFQCKALTNTVRDMCDVLAVVKPHSGRHTLLTSFAAHCVLIGAPCTTSLIIASSAASAEKLYTMAAAMGVAGCGAHLARGAADWGHVPAVVIATLSTAGKWAMDDFTKCATILVEDCAALDSSDLEALMHRAATANVQVNFFLLTTRSPDETPASIRYALHRRRRRYCFDTSGPGPAHTFLLAQDSDDRYQVAARAVRMKGLRRVLVLTHSKEVRDTRAMLQQDGSRVFAVVRGTSTADQTRNINDFLAATYAVLVAADAFTGLDLLDVDAVIQLYPPQKSMPEEEWADFMRCIRMTANPAAATLFVTLLGPDEMTLASYFMKRIEWVAPLVLSVAPGHPRFADIVRYPLPAAKEVIERVKVEEETSSTNSKEDSSTIRDQTGSKTVQQMATNPSRNQTQAQRKYSNNHPQKSHQRESEKTYTNRDRQNRRQQYSFGQNRHRDYYEQKEQQESSDKGKNFQKDEKKVEKGEKDNI